MIRRDDDIWVKEGVLFPNENGYKETPSWGGFLEILSGKYDESIIQENVEDLKFKYINDTHRLLQSIKARQSISFDTYQSKKGFLDRNQDEYLYLFLDDKLKLWYPIRYSDFNIGTSNIQDMDCYESIYESFVSDEFEYDETTLKKIAEIIDENCDFVKDYSDWLLSDKIQTRHKIERTRKPGLRFVTEYYEPRLKMPKGYSCKQHIVTFFAEDTTHCSDEWWNKWTGGHRTFMVWSKGSMTISLLPIDNKYATYTFWVDTSKSSLEVASYVIWRYFTSNLKNKRQGFQAAKIFNLFGIFHVVK